MASCVALSCSCNTDTCPSSVVNAAINCAMSGTVGGTSPVRRLNVIPVSGVAAAALDAGAADPAFTGAGAVLSAGDEGSAGPGDATGTGVEGTPEGWASSATPPSPFIEPVLKSLPGAAVICSSSRVRYVIS